MDVFFKSESGSFSINKTTLQFFLVSKRYILVVNFGKNIQQGGEGGGGAWPIQKVSLQIFAYLQIFEKMQ